MKTSLASALRYSVLALALGAPLLCPSSGRAAPDPTLQSGRWIARDGILPPDHSRLLLYTAAARDDGRENRLLLRVNRGDLELSDHESGRVLKRRPLKATTGVYIKGADGATNDTLTIDFGAGGLPLADGIHYDGGSGGYDTLDLNGGNFTRQHFEAINSSDGIFLFDQLRVTFTNLEPVNDTASAATFTYNGTNANETIGIVNGPVVSGFQTTSITNTGSETVNFANKTTVTINAGAGTDNVTLNVTTPAAGLVNLTVDGGGNVDGLNGTGDTLNVGVISLPTGTISLKGFFVVNDNNSATLNITANQLALRLVDPATFGSGAEGSGNQLPAGSGGSVSILGQIGQGGDPLETDANTLAFSGVTTAGASSGSFTLANTGSVVIGTVDGITGSRGANISLTVTGGAITVAHNISMFGGMDLTTVDASSTGQNITINSGVALTASNADMIIQAGDNFTLSTGASMSASGGFCNVAVDFGDADGATGATVTLNGTVASGFGSAFVSGGPQNDTFNINSGSSSGRLQLNAAGGQDTYHLSLLTITTGSGIDVVESTGNGTDTVNLIGTANAETFTVGAAAGGAPAGHVSVRRTSNSGNSPAVTFDPTTVEAVNVNGADAGDSYLFNAANVAYTLAINDTGAANSGTDSITVNGSTGNDTLNASGTQISRGSEVANFSGIEAVTVNGDNGSDNFNITPSATIGIAVAGGAPAPPTSPGDTLIVNVSGTTNPARSDTSSASGFAGSYTFSDRQAVSYSQIETRESTPACTSMCPADIVLPAPSGSCSRQVSFGGGASAGCGTVTYSPVSGSTFPVGTTTVAATSSLGTSCSFTVTVTDTQGPSMSCPAPITVSNAPGQCSAVVDYNVTAADNCPGVTTSADPPSGSTFPVGTTQVTAGATDSAGNVNFCQFPVTVNDTENPSVSCPGDITVQAPSGANSATVDFAVGGTDNCAGLNVQSNPASGSEFPVGQTTVTATATDGAGRTAQCTFSVTVQPGPTPTATPSPTPPSTRFANISTRLRVETGENVLIGGFIITGSDDKKFIARAIGPSLGIAGALADPQLQLFNSEGGLVAENDNWQDSPDRQAIIDSTIPPADELEAAIVQSLAPAAYTAIVSGVNGGTGVGLVEVYDLDGTVDSKLANISTRGLVKTGVDVLIGGTIVLGDQPQKVIIRAIGPSLPVEGRLQDPRLELFDGEGNPIAANDNWRDTQQAEVEATGIPPGDERESAIVRTLTPGAYTAIVRGAGETTGVALVEVYALDPSP